EMHPAMAATLDKALDQIAAIQKDARSQRGGARPRWPMIVLQSPKGWTGPKKVDGVQIEGTWRAHQVPLSELAAKPAHVRLLEEWLRSYAPEELFETDGSPKAFLRELSPAGPRRIGSNPNANGGLLLRHLALPDIQEFAFDVQQPGAAFSESTRI